MKLNLEDLSPKESIFSTKDDNGTEFNLRLRPFNLKDEAWLKRNFGGEKLKEVFDSLDSESICRIAYQQLDNESKKKLFTIKFMDIDENGNEVEEKVNGPERLAYLVQGVSTLFELMKKLLETRGISLPVLEQMGEEELGKLTEALRKSKFKMGENKKAKTGEKSST